MTLKCTLDTDQKVTRAELIINGERAPGGPNGGSDVSERLDALERDVQGLKLGLATVESRVAVLEETAAVPAPGQLWER